MPPGLTGVARWLGPLWLGIAAACAPLQVELEPVLQPTAALTVDEAVELALRNHPDVRSARERLLQAAADVDEAESAFWPDVSVAAQFVRTDAPSRVFAQLLDQGQFTSGVDFNDPGAHSNLRVGAGASLTLYDGGRRRARLSRAEARLGSGAAFEDEVRGLIAFEAASAWYRVHASVAAAELAAREAPVLAELLAAAEAEGQAGAALPLEVLERRIELARAQNAAESAQASAQRARSALAQRLGLGIEVDLELQAPEPWSESAPEPLAGVLERARFARPELVRAQFEIEAALAGLRGAEAGYLPELSVQAALGTDGEDLDFARSNWLFGVGLVQDLTDTLRTPQRVRRAASELLVAHEAGRASLLAVEGEVEAAWLDEQEARRALALAHQDLERAEQVRQQLEAEHDLGAARATSLAAARLEAERAATQEHIAALRCAQAQIALAHASGTFPAREPVSQEQEP